MCFVSLLHGCVWYVCCYVSQTLLQCLCNYREEGYWPVCGALVYVFVGFWDWDYVSQLPYVWYYVGLRAAFNMFVRNASPRVPMCFRCLIFSLSGPCDSYFYFVLLPLGPELL